ncbi:alkaline D-peptidase [Rhodococcus sp. 14-2483-1-1]|uniref:serine hydrolase domain-containing protein n=1 Tax=unclassified Rhodococcus (in: high G+C Gram-positive bacteria) TaxID=192944 RepID=UPI000B9AB814|nr:MULTISPECIES: serine hydrolase domain-containing protein [unclassified Rhodococcus (in: high G+C Gram-positive bacteria)]OZC49677.1 alkaline D-peptidase [Rhodococcus sp. WWJCD1]OZF37898.1 alkaline D-peptidase [Rhodococcus sp. 14-2483-1-1]
MSKLRILAALTVSTSLLVSGCTSSDEPSAVEATTTTPSSGTIRTDDVQAALDALVDAGSVAAVAQVRDGENSWSGAAGLVERDGTEAASADDPVRIASVTKSMVAAVVLQLVDEGRLQLDQQVDELLPGLLPKPVTVRQLLDHTSGVPDYLVGFDSAEQIAARSADSVTDDELISQALAMPWPTDPGSTFAYSNTNYVLLGRIAADLDGKSIGQSLQDRIFDPLGMTDTTYPTDAAIADDALHGYTLENGTYTDVTDYDASIWSSGAAVVSTVGDMNTFFRGLFDGTLIPQNLIDEMQVLTPSAYGLGLLLGGDACNPGAGELVFGQRGNGFGYRTFQFSSPDGHRQVSLAWTTAAPNPAADPLEQPATNALITGLASTCPA